MCVCVREDEDAPTRDFFLPVSAFTKNGKITSWIFGESFYDFRPTAALVMVLKSKKSKSQKKSFPFKI